MGNLRFTAVAICIGVAGAVGCSDETTSLFVRGNVAPDKQCTWDSNADAFTALGTLDVAFASGYKLFPVVYSQLRTRSSSTPPSADPNYAIVDTAEVTLTRGDGALLAFNGLPNPFSLPVTGSVPPASGTTLGKEIVPFDAIPKAYVDVLKSAVSQTGTFDLVIHVVFRGETIGKVEVESSEWNYPLKVCGGCLAQITTATDISCGCYPNGQDAPVPVNMSGQPLAQCL